MKNQKIAAAQPPKATPAPPKTEKKPQPEKKAQPVQAQKKDKASSLAVSEIENESYHFVQQSPPFSHNLMIESENLKHSKKNHDNSLVKIHANAHTHSKANKDIVIHAKKE